MDIKLVPGYTVSGTLIPNSANANLSDATVKLLDSDGEEVAVTTPSISGDGETAKQDLILLFQYLSGWKVEIH